MKTRMIDYEWVDEIPNQVIDDLIILVYTTDKSWDSYPNIYIIYVVVWWKVLL